MIYVLFAYFVVEVKSKKKFSFSHFWRLYGQNPKFMFILSNFITGNKIFCHLCQEELQTNVQLKKHLMDLHRINNERDAAIYEYIMFWGKVKFHFKTLFEMIKSLLVVIILSFKSLTIYFFFVAKDKCYFCDYKCNIRLDDSSYTKLMHISIAHGFCKYIKYVLKYVKNVLKCVLTHASNKKFLLQRKFFKKECQWGLL